MNKLQSKFYNLSKNLSKLQKQSKNFSQIPIKGSVSTSNLFNQKISFQFCQAEQQQQNNNQRRFEQHSPLKTIDNKPEIDFGIEQLKQNCQYWTKQQFKEENEKIIQKLSENTSKDSIDIFQDEIKEFYTYLKSIILDSETDGMAKMSQHYLQKQGKLVRPTLHLLLGNLLYDIQHKNEKNMYQDSPLFKSQKIWAGVIELLHISSLIHDDIIDNAKMRRGLSASHSVYGKQQSTFSANWIIGRSGRKIAQLGSLHMFQLYSEIMVDLTRGEYIQAQQDKDYSQNHLKVLMDSYLSKTYYKTAALMAHSLRGVAILNDHENTNQNNELVQELCFKFAQNIGIAFQLIDDILDYTQDAEQLGKQNLADVREGNITGPILFLLEESQGTADFQYLVKLLKKDKLSDTEVNHISRILKQSCGLEKTLHLALLHTIRGLEFLNQLGAQSDSLPYQGLKSVALKIIKRTH